MTASDNNSPVLIQVVFPFENRPPLSDNSTDSVTMFPQAICLGKKRFIEIKDPIFYDGVFYSLDDFISKCPLRLRV